MVVVVTVREVEGEGIVKEYTTWLIIEKSAMAKVNCFVIMMDGWMDGWMLVVNVNVYLSFETLYYTI